jgi:hypothetical protein
VRWEYTESEISINSEQNQQWFNEYGEDGWECYAVSDNWAYFKRPIIMTPLTMGNLPFSYLGDLKKEDDGKEQETAFQEAQDEENPCQPQGCSANKQAGRLYCAGYTEPD